MKREFMPMYAVNANISPSLTPSGRDTFSTNLSFNVGTAIDRVSNCVNYLPYREPSFKMISGTQVFKESLSNRYLTFSICCGEGGKQYIVTCHLEHYGDLAQGKALQLIDKGMAKALTEVR
ncbi:hypothetical protein [Agarivorans gilvus]|uniref:Uncharacterized protein n=1 Tax=Agarivorans gilvus TaxID=680279 RepID=A0ABQ1HWB3_9ALTE|nr:hypothetical protein [Agarivorans gilvus]GGA91746.1 hypothetical protein GCM10007414_00460 [Agarivorans gilvus]